MIHVRPAIGIRILDQFETGKHLLHRQAADIISSRSLILIRIGAVMQSSMLEKVMPVIFTLQVNIRNPK
jgi:hypothetical protein